MMPLAPVLMIIVAAGSPVPDAGATRALTLTALVPEGTPGSSSRAVDATGLFRCRQRYEASPPDDDKACRAAGYLLSGEVIHLAQPHKAPEIALARPLSVAKLARCDASRTPMVPTPVLLARVAPDLARVPVETSGGRFVGSATCRDPRIALVMPAIVEHSLDGATHRLRSQTEARVQLVQGDRVVSEWLIGADSVEDRCKTGARRAIDWSLDLEVVCQGPWAVASSVVWHPHLNWPCYQSAWGFAPGNPGAKCVPAAPEEHPAFEVRQSATVRWNLDDGAVEHLDLRAPRLVPVP
jgi:hypothetical protein